MRRVWCAILAMGLVLCCMGCHAQRLDPRSPVTLTFWHVYGSQSDSPMNEMVDEFNRTQGAQRGVLVDVTSVSNSTAIHDALVASAHGIPGAAELPDLFVCYPKTALAMGADTLLNWSDCLSQDERDAYVASFVDEGELDGRLVVFPVAKSTEVLYVNTTIFDRFCAETGASREALATWEGLFDLSRRYYDWSDGKTMLMLDSLFNYMLTGARQKGADLFDGERIAWDDPLVQGVWRALAQAALRGQVCLQDGYATVEMMTGGVAACVESSASILYYQDTVTYPDNTTEPLTLDVLPMPVFQGGEAMVVQRGVGLCARALDEKRSEAAAVFVRWLTEPERNLDFAMNTGYLPVQTSAFEQIGARIATLSRAPYRAQYESVADMFGRYDFFTPPQFEGFGALEKRFDASVKAILREARAQYTAGEDILAQCDALWARLRQEVQPS